MQHSHPTLADLPLASIEHGPLRDLMETLFEVALDTECRQRGATPSNAVVAQLHDEILPSIFTLIFTRGEHKKLRCEQYVLSREGQRELQALIARRLAHALPAVCARHQEGDSCCPPTMQTLSLPS